MIDHKRHTVRIIDLGLADYHEPGKTYSVHVDSKHYKAPELILNMKPYRYDYAFDMFSIGCWCATLLTFVSPIFNGRMIFEDMEAKKGKVLRHIDDDQIIKFAEIMGSKE